MPRPDDTMIGRTIAGKFVIESLIGSGAMGHVYRAQQFALEKTVALKVLHPDLARDETFMGRFHREAKAASRLDHPNSMRVIDFGADVDGTLYIAMEYLDGRDLLRVIQEDGAMSAERIAGILTQALAALVVAHDMGVVHRDLKPENIMVLEAIDDEGRHTDVIKVCDFGIAKITGRSGAGVEPSRGPITTAGLVVGTPEYMSPEQGKGEPLDLRTDLYSMGVILFHLMTGRVPFEAENVLGIVFKHVNEEPPKPSSIRAGADPRLEAVCMRALKKKRDDRYQTAREMRSALRPIAGSDGVVFSAAVPRISPTSNPPRSDSGELSHAKTLDMPGAPGAEGPSPAVSEAPLSRGTTGTTAALPALPVSRPSILWLAAFALATGAAATLLYSKYVEPRAPVALETPAAAATSSSTPDPSASVAPEPSSMPSASAAASSHAPSGPSHTPAAAKTAPLAAHAAMVAPTPPPAASAPLTASPSASFSLTTSVASPNVQRATGVSARDVRAALPSWKFTQCYRDAMTHAGKRLEGHVVLSLTLDPSGTVTRVSIVGPPALLSTSGSCFEDAVNQLHIHNSSSAGATADIDVVCTPE